MQHDEFAKQREVCRLIAEFSADPDAQKYASYYGTDAVVAMYRAGAGNGNRTNP